MKSSPRRKARSHTPRPPRSRDWSPLNACNTRDTELPSSEDVPNLPRMPPTSTLNCWPSASTRSVRREPSSERDVLLPSENRCTCPGVLCSVKRSEEETNQPPVAVKQPKHGHNLIFVADQLIRLRGPGFEVVGHRQENCCRATMQTMTIPGVSSMALLCCAVWHQLVGTN